MIGLASQVAPGHAARRAAERYGIALTISDFREAMLDIQDACLGIRERAVLLARVSARSERWVVKMKGIAVPVVYDPSTATICTILQPSHLTSDQHIAFLRCIAWRR